jgi:extracellular factor (EF) 3-hydroxypalmitic acid methyl ester biosynthesis protein
MIRRAVHSNLQGVFEVDPAPSSGYRQLRTRPHWLLGRSRSGRGAALANVRALTDELCRARTRSEAATPHATIGIVHRLLDALLSAEQAGLERASILPLLGPARALHAESSFLRRLQDWPRGYAGDFETIELMCDAQVSATDPLVRSLEWYAMNAPVAQQHRNKVEQQAALIAEIVKTRENPEILLVGCGGCRDLRSLEPPSLLESARFTLNDSDPEAIEFARSRLPARGFRCQVEVGNALRVVPRLARKSRYDLIIAGGIFDYLPDSAATLLLRHGYHALAPGGVLFFTNIARGNPYRPWIEYLVDWRLIERSAEDLGRLLDAADVPSTSVTFTRDLTGLTFLIRVERPGQ